METPLLKKLPFARVAAILALCAAVFVTACGNQTGVPDAPDATKSAPVAPPLSYEKGKDLVASLVDTHSLIEITEMVETWVASEPGLNGDCHGLLRHTGVAFAKKHGLTEVPPTVCDYGMVHGLLYGYAEVVTDMDEYVREVIPFCAKVAPEPGHLRDKCIHGVGHGLALLSQNDIIKGLDACDSLSVDEVYHQCTGALVMEFGEDRLTALGWSMSHGAENSEDVLTVDEKQVPALCDGRTATCHERYWMFVLPPRDKVSGTEDGSLAEKTCARFTGEYDLKLCLTGFGNLAGSFWLMFDFQDGVSYPPDSTEDADIAAKRAIDRCTRHPDPGICLQGLIPGTVAYLYNLEHPYMPDFCRFASEEYLEACELAVQAAKDL